MEITGGMEFWVNDKGRIRLFTIAESSRSKAQALLRERLPGVEFTTWQPVPSGVVTMLKMRIGEILEWSPASAPRGRSM
jgi:hypothetical protein